MSKEFNNFENYTSNENRFENTPEPLSVAHEARLHAIELLKKGAQDESMPVSERIKRVESLITLLKEEALQAKSPILSKIDIAEAETYREQLLHGPSAHAESNKEEEEAF